jgi:thiol-disulfide isomerase/thioredoxin
MKAIAHIATKGVDSMRLLSYLLALLLLLTAGAYSQKAPDFSSDAVWLDSGAKVPHSIKAYRGRVVLVDFWEYTCINCIRDFAVLKRWYAKYHPYGFEIIGVHFGEFAIGYKPENVRRAAQRFQLPWPIVADVNGSIWKAYKSESWPNRYLIDSNGEIVLHIEGEGNNAPMEAKIRELLMPQHPEIAKIPLDPDENTFVPQCGRVTEETYVGDWFGRGALQNREKYSDGYVVHFKGAQEPDDGRVILDGNWRTDHDGVTSAGKHDDKATLRYHARSVYAVMTLDDTKKPIRVDVLQDGAPLADAAGVDVKTDARGSYIEVSEPRMYYLIKNPALAPHLLTLSPETRGFTLHSFTYGNDCQQNFEEK